MAKENTIGQGPDLPNIQEISTKLNAKFRSLNPKIGLSEARLSLDTPGQQMPFVEAIAPEQIVQTVMSSVGNAGDQINMTMLLDEELQSPLPPSYHQLLQRKLDEGIKITRIGFGTREDFDAVSQKVGLNSENFTFVHNPDVQKYQRFIVIDDNFAFFNVEGKYYKTTDTRFVNFFQEYAQVAAKE